MLKLDRITTHYDKLKVLDDVTLELREGEIVALMGPNGAGKSTVLKTIFGLVPHQSGKIIWNNKEIEPLPHRMVEYGIAFVPQGRRVFRDLTVEENLEIGAITVKDKKLIKNRVEEMMHLFPVLKQKRSAKSKTLSGGQQQSLAIARGLMTKPRVLLLDEPSLGLAPKIVKEVFATIKLINEQQKASIMVVEHNLKSLFEIVDRAYVLDKGRVVAHDSGKKIIESDVLERVFLGKEARG